MSNTYVRLMKTANLSHSLSKDFKISFTGNVICSKNDDDEICLITTQEIFLFLNLQELHLAHDLLWVSLLGMGNHRVKSVQN